MSQPTLLLCAGLQSGGTTLVSWCFLQRRDVNGILDANYDVLPEIPRVSEPLAWCKFTVAAFRLGEAAAHYEDAGWSVRPLLVVRDPRAVFRSLVRKPYGFNGTSAEDPPVRLRLRRFHEDWLQARDAGWPILSFEEFLLRPEESLRRLCQELDLPWDGGMMSWPKALSDIAVADWGNPTFHRTMKQDLLSSIRPDLAEARVDGLSVADLRWVERELTDLIQAMGYPEHLEGGDPGPRAEPAWELTRRARANRVRQLVARSARQVPVLRDLRLWWNRRRVMRTDR